MCALLLYCALRLVNQLGGLLGASSFSASRAAAGPRVVELASGCAAASASSASMAVAAASMAVSTAAACALPFLTRQLQEVLALRSGEAGSELAVS